MTPHAVKTGHIPTHVFELFKEMREVTEAFPDPEDGELTCHAVCAALASTYPVKVVDGLFSTGFSHSWLVHDDAPGVIMDMYPVAGGAPLIVYTGFFLSPFRGFYTAKEIEYDQPTFKRQVKKLTDWLEERFTPMENAFP